MSNSIRWVWTLGAVAALAGCTEGTQPFGFLKGAPKESATAETSPAPATSSRIVERDVEAPEVFSVTEPGLWDGRPSLGGVWVAHPGVKDPERVIIRNPANGKFVIGALFRRERENPGPRLQVSSDAAAALGVLAGAPTELAVVALRREETPEPVTMPSPSTPEGALPENETIAAAPLDAPAPPTRRPVAKPGTALARDVAATASAAIAAAEAPPAPPKPTKPAAPKGKMFLQIGIFSIEANAKRATDQLAKVGVSATIRTEKTQGKTFWSVVAGPAASVADRDAMLKKVKGVGFPDAYAVSK
ncbi:SPOR domain-containing protein [Rhodobacter sp. TJ_12]|uniref:SPOR domain-containing protein n=1 Tax=Rhodobacter sp. TJ_12 TaxID=2029399 RepID=UPI001CBBC640|nr:SPOR domain-containing protein [Rhodobacter sp. TJ_12]MBZ4021946.1 SPOR domain-containing protein [Rhodobacter sp. TJ_12]